jgi:hypothetical protein
MKAYILVKKHNKKTAKKKPDDESGHKECMSNVVLANSEK